MFNPVDLYVSVHEHGQYCLGGKYLNTIKRYDHPGGLALDADRVTTPAV